MNRFRLKAVSILMTAVLGAGVYPPSSCRIQAAGLEISSGEDAVFSEGSITGESEVSGEDVSSWSDIIFGEDEPSGVTVIPEDGIIQDDSIAEDDASDSLFEEETESETEDAGQMGEPEVVMETAELSDNLYAPHTIEIAPGAASIAEFGIESESASATASVNASGSSSVFLFGDQLSGEARRLYDSKVQFYAVDHNTGEWVYVPGKDVYTFRGRLSGITYDKTDPSTLSARDICKGQMMRDMQGAADAFKQDHPEVFWIRSPRIYQYGYKYDKSSVKISEDGTKTATFYIAQINYMPVEPFEGAGNLIAEYESGVSAALTSVRSMADSFNTEGVSGDSPQYRALLVRAADQYLSQRLHYDSAALAEAVSLRKAENNGAAVVVHDVNGIYTSAAAFLPEGEHLSHGAVCEGYAKAMKVICDRLGIPCVCVSGLSDRSRLGSGHMWNAVCIGGVYYLTDPTWDDEGDISHTESSRQYLLVSDYPNNIYLTKRQSTGNLNDSGLDGITIFSYPEISLTCYETSHVFTGQQPGEPDCRHGVSYTKTCQVCAYEEKVEFPPLGHQYEKEVVSPTCTEDGYILFTCVRGDSSYRKVLKAPGHKYKVKVVPPTVRSRGYTAHICVRCGHGYRDSYKPALPGKTYLKKVSAGSAGKFTVEFKRTQKFTKYEVQYSQNADFSDAVSKNVTRSGEYCLVTIRAKKNKVYYVRVRVLSAGGAGAWSVTRRVKTRRK